MTLLSRTGNEPHFGADSDRVFFRDNKGKDTVLKSVRLDDREVVEHSTGTGVLRYRVSPDGRWLAFFEHYNAFVVPFPATGRTVKIGRKSDALPQARVSRDAGDYVHWSGDSQKLHWSTGPTLFTQEVEHALQAKKGRRPTALGIGFTHPTDRPEGTVALVGARVVTMNGSEVIADGAVVWTGDRITAVGPRSKVKVPSGARVFDGTGATIIPGLVDVHAHGAVGTHGIVPQQSWTGLAALAFGVTTIHDPSNHTQTIFAASELQRAGMIVAPRILSTGTILYGAEAPEYMARVDSLEDARTHVRRLKAVGAFSVKSYNQPRRDQRQQLARAARELKMMVVPEGGATFMHNLTQIVDGHTSVEHAIPVAQGYDDVVQLWSQTRVGYTPTFVVDTMGGGGKRDAHSYEYYDRDSGIAVFTSPTVRPGAFFYYFDPIHRLGREARMRWADPEGRRLMKQEALEAAKAAVDS